MAAKIDENAAVVVETIDPNAVKQELLARYPTKVARKRAKQIVINKVGDDQSVPEIGSNSRAIPGIITQRGCSYAGCKGVVLGPTRDFVNLTHGPIGCGFYSWLTRRNQTRPPTAEDANFHALLLFDRPPGRGHRIRGRKKAQGRNPGGIRHLQAQGHQHLCHLPGRADRRRHPQCGKGDEREARYQYLRFQLRGLQGSKPVGGPPHSQQRHIQARRGD